MVSVCILDLNITMETPAAISEGESVLVCVGVGDELRREVTLRLDTVNGTAIGGHILPVLVSIQGYLIVYH